MIEVVSVGKLYGDVVALQDVSFEVKSGEVVGLLGPNGAGKTTLIRMLTGYFEPSEGHIVIDGLDIESDRLGVQQLIGYLPEQTPLYPEMLVQEYLNMVADFRQIPTAERPRMLGEAIWATGLENHLTQAIGELSKGLRQRVGLAQAIVHQPKVLILDEPTSGLDPTQVIQVRALIRRLAKNTTVLFSSHVLSEVEQVCDRVIILLGGRVRADARLSELRSTHRALVAIAESSPGSECPATSNGKADPTTADGVKALLEGLEDVRKVQRVDGRVGLLTFELDARSDTELCRRISRLAWEHHWELGELRPIERDLETVFRELTTRYREAVPSDELLLSEVQGADSAHEVSP